MGVEGMKLWEVAAIVWIGTFFVILIRIFYFHFKTMAEARDAPIHWKHFAMWRKKNLTEKGVRYRRQFFRHIVYFYGGGIASGTVILILQALNI